MRPYLLILGFLALFVIPVRPFVLAWVWLRQLRPLRSFDAWQGGLVGLHASAEEKSSPEPVSKQPVD